MNLQRKAFTVFGIIGILAVLHLFLFQNDAFSKPLVSDKSQTEQVEPGTTDLIMDGVAKFLSFSGFRNATLGNVIMVFVGLFLYILQLNMIMSLYF